MKINQLSFLVLALLLFTACKDKEPIVDIQGTESAAIGESISVQDTVVIYDKIKWNVRIGTPTPCYWFSRAVLEEEPGQSKVSLFVAHDPEEICITVTGSIDTNVSIPARQLGEHILILNPDTDFEIRDTVFVKN